MTNNDELARGNNGASPEAYDVMERIRATREALNKEKAERGLADEDLADIQTKNRDGQAMADLPKPQYSIVTPTEKPVIPLHSSETEGNEIPFDDSSIGPRPDTTGDVSSENNYREDESKKSQRATRKSRGGKDGGDKPPSGRRKFFSGGKIPWFLIVSVLLVLLVVAYFVFIHNSTSSVNPDDTFKDSVTKVEKVQKAKLAHYKDSMNRVVNDSLKRLEEKNNAIPRYTKRSWFWAFVSDNKGRVFGLIFLIILTTYVLLKLPKEERSRGIFTRRRILSLSVVLIACIAFYFLVSSDPINLSEAQASRLEDKIRNDFKNNPVVVEKVVPDPAAAAEITKLKVQNADLKKANQLLTAELEKAKQRVDTASTTVVPVSEPISLTRADSLSIYNVVKKEKEKAVVKSPTSSKPAKGKPSQPSKKKTVTKKLNKYAVPGNGKNENRNREDCEKPLKKYG